MAEPGRAAFKRGIMGKKKLEKVDHFDVFSGKFGMDDVDCYPRSEGALTHIGLFRKIKYEDIPALNFELLAIGGDPLSKSAAEWELNFDHIMSKHVYDNRGRGLIYEKLPAFFMKLGLGLDEKVMGESSLANIACWLDQPKLLALVAPHANLKQVDHYGRDLVEMCASYGSVKCLRLLIDLGCDVDKPRTAQGETPLMIAAGSAAGHDNIVKVLANPDRCAEVDLKGMSALSHACEMGRLSLKTVELLCSMSNVDLIDKEGETPLLRAIARGQVKPERPGADLPAFKPDSIDYCFQVIAAHADCSLHAEGMPLPEEACGGCFKMVPGGASIGAWLASKREAKELAKIPARGLKKKNAPRV